MYSQPIEKELEIYVELTWVSQAKDTVLGPQRRAKKNDSLSEKQILIGNTFFRVKQNIYQFCLDYVTLVYSKKNSRASIAQSYLWLRP